MARPKAFDEAEALQKALDTFWHQGYHATSMQDLVASMGINRASLYDTFGDKHQLFMRALNQYQQQSFQGLRELTANDEVVAPVRIRRVLELMVTQALADDQQKGCFLVNVTTELAPHDAQAQALVCGNQQFLEDLLTGILLRGQERGEVRSTATPQAQARLLISVLNGMRVMAKANPDPQILRDVVNTAMLALA